MRREGWLLAAAGGFLASSQAGLLIVTDRAWYRAAPFFAWMACAAVGWWVLQKVLPRRDPYLYPPVMLLTGWGVILVARLVPRFTERQTVWMLVGMAAMLAICALPDHLRWLRDYRYTWLTGGLFLLLATIALGVNPSGFGPRLWLGFDDYFFQPSEVLKVLLVVFLASYMADHHQVFHNQHMMRSLPSWRFLSPIFLMWGLCVVILVWQRDLGTATIFFLVFMLMLYVASGQSLLLVGGVGLLVAALLGGYYLYPVVALRVDIWLNPWSDPDNTAFQLIQSLLAIAEGGIFGVGIGQGIPTFIPVVHTDFAYAAIVEEWGALGGASVLAALFLVIWRGLRIAILLQDRPFHAYLAIGLSLVLMVQTMLIVGGALAIIPLTGVTLPFVSYGGSSLLTSFIVLGLLLKLSAIAQEPAA